MLKFIQKNFGGVFYGKTKEIDIRRKGKIVKEFKQGATISYLMKKYGIPSTGTISVWERKYDEGTLGIDNRGKRRSYYKWLKKGKPIANNYSNEIAKIISGEHNKLKRIYGTIRLKYHIKNKYNINLNHKLIRRYKTILGLETLKRSKKGLSVKKAKEKNLNNKAPYLFECNFKSDTFGKKQTSDVSYIQCSKEIKPVDGKIINTDQGGVYFAYEYIELSKTLGFTRSMSYKGCCWENSPIENWFYQLKYQLEK